MPEPNEPLHVGYVLKQYPRLSETFILSEILGLEHQGVRTSIYSLRPPTEGRFHREIASVKGPVHYVEQVGKAGFLSAVRALPGLRLDRLPEALAFLDRLPEDRRARLLLNAIDVAVAAEAAGVDHLHAHFLTVAAQTAHLVAILTGLPYSVTAHAKDIYRNTVDWDMAARIASGAVAVVTVCDANLRYLTHRLDGIETSLIRVYNGLGPQDPADPHRHTRGLILGVGRLVEKKGFDLLIEAVAAMAPTRPDLRCVLIGDGDQRAELEARTARLGLTSRVRFTGALPQNEVASWLRRASVLAAPCRVATDGNQDALPTVLLEALAAGVPAVTTPVAGIPEIITHGKEGLLVPCDDAPALADALGSLLDDPQRRAEMAAAGPGKLALRFDRRATIADLMKVFRVQEPVG